MVGLIPKAQNPISMDGKLTGWDGAFVTPIHVGHPDFANRGGQFLYLWDEKNFFIGLRCLDQKPAHIGPDKGILVNPIYTGVGPFPRLVEDAAWVRACAKLIEDEGSEQFPVNLLVILRECLPVTTEQE